MSLFAGKQRKLLTNAFLFRDRQILLGRKLRGWRKGIFNGFGGKLDPGETVLQAAKRELNEGLTAVEIEKVGIFTQTFTDKPTVLLEIHVFDVKKWDGEPQKTDEMEPVWVPFDEIPYDNMWKDDVAWYPFLLEKKKFVGHCHFKGDEVMLAESFEEAADGLFDDWDETKPSALLESHMQRCLDQLAAE